MAYQEKRLPSTITVPSSSSYLNIDTRDQLRYDADGYIENTYQNPFDISIYKPDSIFQGRVLRMALTNFNMLWSCPNVNPINDILFLERNSLTNPGEIEQHVLRLSALQAESGNVPTGFYTPADLAAAIQSYLRNTTGATPAVPLWGNTLWTCTFNDEQGSFSIATGLNGLTPSQYAFRINPMLGKPLGSQVYQYTNQRYNLSTTLANMMGYLNASKVMADEVTGDTASMIYTRYIDVVSDELTSYQYTRDASSSKTTGRNLIARIFISPNQGNVSQNGTSYFGTSPFTINYEPKNVKYMKWDSGAFLSGLNIRILDEFGNILYDQVPGTQTALITDPANPTVKVVSSRAGSASYCQMTFTVTEGDN